MQECKVQREAASAFLLKKQQRGPGAEVEWGEVWGKRWETWARSCMDGFVGHGKDLGFFFFFLVGRFWRVMNRK